VGFKIAFSGEDDINTSFDIKMKANRTAPVACYNLIIQKISRAIIMEK